MQPLPTRRSVLRAAAGSLAGLTLGVPLFRSPVKAQSASGSVNAVRLRDDLHVLTVDRTNVVALTGPDGTALVDGGSRDHSAALLEAVSALPDGGQVHTLFNTHWHPEQTGSNESLGRDGATIVAHVNTRLWLTTDVTWPWNGRTVEPLPEPGLPDETFYDRREVDVGGRSVECGHIRHAPHTDGDMYVFFPDANVLAVGDAVTGEGWPTIDWWTGGWIGGIVGGLELLLSLANADTRIVPARGPVFGRDELQAQYDMYDVIFERLSRQLYSGMGPEEAVLSRPTEEFDAKMGPPDEFVRRAFESLWGYLSPDA